MNVFRNSTVMLVVRLSVSFILLYFVLNLVGVSSVFSAFSSLSLFPLFVALIFSFLLALLKAFRWRFIVHRYGMDLSFGQSVNFTLQSQAFGLVTPGRVGEVIKTKFLADKSKKGYLESFVTVFLDKVFDLVVLVLLATLGLRLFDLGLPSYVGYSFFVLLGLCLFGLLFYDFSINLSRKVLPGKYKGLFSKIPRNLTISLLLLSVGMWFVLGIMAYFVMQSIGFDVSFFLFVFAVPLLALSSIIPITVGGVGVREVVAVGVFSLVGISGEEAVLFSLLYTFIGLGIPAILGAILYMKK